MDAEREYKISEYNSGGANNDDKKKGKAKEKEGNRHWPPRAVPSNLSAVDWCREDAEFTRRQPVSTVIVTTNHILGAHFSARGIRIVSRKYLSYGKRPWKSAQ